MELRQRLNLDGKEVILYAGTFQPYEGLDLLVRAIGHIVRQRPSAHLVIVGGSAGFAGGSAAASTEERHLLSVVQQENLGAHVTFTGRIPHSEVIDMYALADVIAYPRRLTRTTALTTPLKPLEPMAMAKPVVASDIPPMRELVSDGKTGVLFREADVADLAQKCTAILGDTELRSRLGANAREWVVRERHWKTLVARYRDIYAGVRAHATDTLASSDSRVSASTAD